MNIFKNILQVELARSLASERHEDQMYGQFVYMYHLMQVDQMVCKVYATDTDLNILRSIAYLHDVIEDTDTDDYDLLECGVIQVVVDAVIKISKVPGESYDDYIKEVVSNEFARKVKLCDTACNLMNSIQDGNIYRINKYTKQIRLLGGF